MLGFISRRQLAKGKKRDSGDNTLIDITVVSASNMAHPDLFVRLFHGRYSAETALVRDSEKEAWNESFLFNYDSLSKINLEVVSRGFLRESVVGTCSIRVDDLTKNKEYSNQFKLVAPGKGKKILNTSFLQLNVCWKDGDHLSNKVLGVTVHSGHDLLAADWYLTGGGLSDPYCIVNHGLHTSRTPIQEQTLNPIWNSFHLFPWKPIHKLDIKVFDYDQGQALEAITGDDFLGEVQLPTRDLEVGQTTRYHLKLHPADKLAKREGNEDRGAIDVTVACLDGYTFMHKMLKVRLLRARGLRGMDWSGLSDPFCELKHGKQNTISETKTQMLEPHWDDTFIFDFQMSYPLKITVFDRDEAWGMYNDHMGQVEIPVNQLEVGRPKRMWYPLSDQNYLFDRECGEVEVEVERVDGRQYHRAVLACEIIQARNLIAMDSNGTSDPYANIKHGNQHRNTAIKKCTLMPEWNHSMKFDFHVLHKLVVEVYDNDEFSLDGDDFLGMVEVPLVSLKKDVEIRNWYRLVAPHNIDDGIVRGEVELRFLWKSEA